MPEPGRHDVFICHASEDKAVAEAVVATLEAAGARCWIAPRDVLPGDSYVEDILAAIDECRLVVLVLSSSTNRSPHVPRELGRAANTGVPILPFRIEDVQPAPAFEFYVSGAHWFDAFTPPLQAHLDRLATTVRDLLGLPPVAPAAGWYDDPEYAGQLRYWDGARWTNQRIPSPPGADRR